MPIDYMSVQALLGVVNVLTDHFPMLFFIPVFIVVRVTYNSFNIFRMRKRFLTVSLKARDRAILTPD